MGSKRRSFLADTQAADTIPLKMVFYLSITGAIILLVAFSWNNVSPLYSGAKDSKQINDATIGLMGIQNGYARSLYEPNAPAAGSICILELYLPDVSYLAFGVDPDPDMNGNLSDTQWIRENNTIICQYKNGARSRYIIDGDLIDFIKGTLDEEGRWVPDRIQPTDQITGVVIEGPVAGTFEFELVLEDKKYTMSRF
ncbi:MAG: hypothetical protein QCH31_09040 [Methanolobus sp.]|nr:hypothetical protein [Methanolobus sp.]